MGTSHAISAVGMFFLVIGLIYQWKGFVLFGDSGALMTLAFVTVVGASLVPDLDNTKATVISALGVTGKPMSTLFRETSRLVQTVVRTKYDPKEPNPHRGFWHTLVGAATLGLITYGLTKLPWSFTAPLLGDVTAGDIAALVIVVGMFNLALTGLGQSLVSSLKKIPVVGELVSLILSVAVVLGLCAVGDIHEFEWVGLAIAFGAVIHILGDALTVAGVPIFFPVSSLLHGKMWWTTRITHEEASSPVLKWAVNIFSVIGVAVGVFLLQS